MSNVSQIQKQGCWVLFEADKIAQQFLTIEPYAVGWEMLPGQKYLVYLLEKPPHMPHVVFHDGGIQVFASCSIVYLNNELLWNYEELEVVLPDKPM